LWFGAIVATLVVAGGGALLARKPRSREMPKTLKCRVCGNVPESGDLCQHCRHEAAEAVRRAAAERAEEQRAGERASGEEERHQNALAEASRLQRLRHEEAARLRQEEQARQQELARQEEERRLREDEARARRQAVDSPDDEFDPHDVLGVPRGASLELIRAAHAEAKAKYDPKLAVDFGGAELQAYFEAKSKAVERAFQLLTK
jgi:colicin import membrane protein